jgi:hypothetical protein
MLDTITSIKRALQLLLAVVAALSAILAAIEKLLETACDER